jgi:hypothetical protein
MNEYAFHFSFTQSTLVLTESSLGAVLAEPPRASVLVQSAATHSIRLGRVGAGRRHGRLWRRFCWSKRRLLRHGWFWRRFYGRRLYGRRYRRRFRRHGRVHPASSDRSDHRRAVRHVEPHLAPIGANAFQIHIRAIGRERERLASLVRREPDIVHRSAVVRRVSPAQRCSSDGHARQILAQHVRVTATQATYESVKRCGLAVSGLCAANRVGNVGTGRASARSVRHGSTRGQDHEPGDETIGFHHLHCQM